MPECVRFEIVKAGTTAIKSPVLVASPNDVANCDGYVLLTASEFSASQQQASPVFVPLTIEQGLTISLAVITLWAMAFVYKSIRSSLSPQATEER